MRLITLNVNGARGTKLEVIRSQVEALAAHHPDVIALSEVTISRLPVYQEEFQRLGLIHVMNSVVDLSTSGEQYRSVCTVIASKFECVIREEAYTSFNLPWPERLLPVVIVTDSGEVEIKEFSLYRKNGYRLDHVLASRSLNPIQCRYLHDFRAKEPERYKHLGFERLSDHSALEVMFDPVRL